ncbi:flavodoxin family protein [Bariatricus sp. SGI.154]|uniref:flavodoxin family protein n=1 Tax=Bariatricus sp. SGI.154 TaxID=3420549 RepID=UPI003CFE26C8
MNILMINGTMRKGSSYHIGKMLIEKIAKKEDQISELFLPKDMPEFCRGCAVCIKDSEKKCLDYLMYMKRITKMIDEADLLVFTSPVHVMHVTGALKALLDHYGYRFMVHRPEESMFRKQAVCITTAAGGGMKSTLKDIKDSLFFWGIAKIYTYGVAVAATSWEEVEKAKKDKIELEIDKIVLKLKRDTEKVKPGIKTKILFYIMRSMHKKGMNPVDQEYWKEKGWLEKERPWGKKEGI